MLLLSCLVISLAFIMCCCYEYYVFVVESNVLCMTCLAARGDVCSFVYVMLLLGFVPTKESISATSLSNLHRPKFGSAIIIFGQFFVTNMSYDTQLSDMQTALPRNL